MADPSKVSRILADWFDRRSCGEALEPEALLSEHPELAEELRAGLDVLDLLGDSAPDGVPPAGAVPERMGDYRIVRELGRGGMGVVYEAEQISMRRKIALKVLAPSLTSTGRATKRFQREAHAAGQLHHTNIVPVFGMGQEKGYWFYAMELVEGRALSDLVHELREESPRRRSQSGLDAFSSSRGSGERPADRATPGTTDDAYFRRIAEVFAGVAEALQVAHEQGIVHRDVKPSNLLLDADGELKIVDFGLAWLDEPGPSMTLTGDLVGTPAYMSPEQAMAKRMVVDHRTDIYSLGATLYEVLTLRPPFDGDTLQALCSQIITKDPALPRRIDEHVPRDLETVVVKAMEKDRDKRYPRAADFAADLRRFAQGLTIQARRVGVVERAWRRVKRHRTVSTLVAALLVVGVVGGYFALQAAEERDQNTRLRYEALLIDAQRLLPNTFRIAYRETVHLRGRATEILARLDDAMALQPDRADAYWLRALMEHRTLAECRRDVDEAARRGLAPETVALLRGYLDVRFQVEPSEAPSVEPTTALGCYAQARLLDAADRKPDALPLLDRALAGSGPGDIVYFLALRYRAILLERCGEFDRALDDHRLLAAMGHDHAHARLRRAGLLERMGQSEDARELLEAALAEAPDDPMVLHELGALWIDWLGDPSIGLAYLDRALAEEHLDAWVVTRAAGRSSRPITALLLTSRGNALARLGRHDEAVAAYARAQEFGPLGSQRFNLATALQRTGRLQEAREQLRTLVVESRAQLEDDPEDGLLRAGLAAALQRLGHTALARMEFERALESSGDWILAREPMLLDEYAKLLNVAGDHDASLSISTAVLERRPDDEIAWANRVVALDNAKRPGEAREAVRQALATLAESPRLNYYHGVLIPESRAEQYSKVIELGWNAPMEILRIADWFRGKARFSGDEQDLRRQIEAEELLLTECRDDPMVRSLRCGFLTNQASAMFSLDDPDLDPRALAKLEESVELDPRYAAFAASMLAARHCTEDPSGFTPRDDAGRQRLRRCAYEWLQRFLAEARRGIETAPIEGDDIARLLASVRPSREPGNSGHPFRAVQDPEALAALPDDERQRWRQLWDEVDALEQQAREAYDRAFDATVEIGEDAELQKRFAALSKNMWWQDVFRAEQHASIAHRYRETGDHARALRHYDMAVRDGAMLPPGRRESPLRLRAMVLAELGRGAEALESLDAAEQVDPMTEPWRATLRFRTRVRCLIALDKLDEAERYARQRLEWLPDDGRGHQALAAILHARGDTAATRPHVEHAIAQLPEDTEVHKLAVEVLEALDDADALRVERERWEQRQAGKEAGTR